MFALEDPPGWVAPYIVVPFKDRGRDLAGWDCWGCCRWVARAQFGLELPSYADDYQGCSVKERRELAALIKGQLGPWREIWRRGLDGNEPVGERPGDCLLLRQFGADCHVGIVVSAGHMLHAEEGQGTTCEQYRGLRWRSRVMGVYRYAG